MFGQLIYLKDVVTLRLDPKKCMGCGLCLMVCPHAVFSLTNGVAEIVNRDACMECGACSRNCPTEALSVQCGVGCATALINTALGRKNSACCTINSQQPSTCLKDTPPLSNRSGCC